MRLAAAVGIALVFVVAGVTLAPASAHPAAPPGGTSPIAGPSLIGGAAHPLRSPAAHPYDLVPRNVRLGFVNETLPNRPATGGVPTSAYPETPAPVLPDTTPTVISFPQAVVTCCVYAEFTAPVGPWAAIEFTDTGSVVGDVYDSSYRAYVDGAQFLEGTTPEYGTWTVHSDLTQYSALFRGTVNVTFILSAATLGGHFVTNVSLAFYPVPQNTAPPRTPSAVVPLWAWNDTYLHAANARIWTNATIPSNVTNATLQLFIYGFGATDEFWYSGTPSATSATFREAIVDVDGKTLAAAYPFPYLNTGGIDLFLWRPVTADFTINDRPFDLDVSGALGMIEGTHEFEANVSGGLNGNTWLVGGSLLLYTAPGAGAASSTQYSYHPSPVAFSTGTTSDDSSATTALVTSSTFLLDKAKVNLTTDLSGSYSNTESFSGGGSTLNQADTQSEHLATVTYRNTTNGSAVTVRTLDFPLVLNVTDTQVEVSSTSTTTTFNFTNAITAFHQEWDETDATGNGTAAAVDGPTAHVDDLATAQGEYAGQEVANDAGGGATISALFGSTSSISKSYTASLVGGSPSWTYEHLLSAAGNNPPGPYNAATLLGDSVDSPIAAAGAVAPAAVDLGGTTQISAWGVGGTGTYHYTWIDLPTGCRGTDSPLVHCIPTASGLYAPMVEVADSGTNATVVALGTLLVEPSLTASVVPARSAWDEGQILPVTALIAGGTGQGLSCTWTVNGTSLGPAQSCSASLNLTGVAGTPTTAQVQVTDSTGTVAQSALGSYTPVQAPLPSVEETAVNGTALRNVGGLQFNVTILGGSAPYVVAWSINGENVSGAASTTLVWIPPSPQTVTAIAWVTDAANFTVASRPVSAPGGVTHLGNGTTSTASTASVDETGWYVAGVVAAAAVAVIILLLIVLQSPKRPPRSSGPNRPARPSAPKPRAPPT